MAVKNSFELTANLVDVVNGGESFYGLAIVSFNGRNMEFYVDTKPASINLANLEKGKTYLIQGELRSGETPGSFSFRSNSGYFGFQRYSLVNTKGGNKIMIRQENVE
jgi:hypothetical protein